MHARLILLDETLKAMWKKVSPNVPFIGIYQDQTVERYFALISGHSKVMIFSAILDVTLACLGLFGLVYLNMVSRIKDYSIMKILGINAFGLFKTNHKDFYLVFDYRYCCRLSGQYVLSKLLFKIVYSDYIRDNVILSLYGCLAANSDFIFHSCISHCQATEGKPCGCIEKLKATAVCNN